MKTEINTFTRKWGNSIAIVIPAEIVERQRIRENEEVIIKVEKRRPRVKDLFGIAPEWKRSTQEIKDEMRKGWLSASDREREEQWKKRETKN